MACLQKVYPKAYNEVQKIPGIKDENQITEEREEELCKKAKETIGDKAFEKNMEKFMFSVDFKPLKEWEASASVWEGKRNWGKKEEKKAILGLLLKKDKFSQDDADHVLRQIKDLWYNPDEPGTYNQLVSSINNVPLEAKMLHSDAKEQEALANKVKNTKVPPAVFEASVEAAVLRASAKAGGHFKSDISTGRLLCASGSAGARAALAEGKAKMEFKIPHEKGYPVKLEMKRKNHKLIQKEIMENFSEEYPANFHFNSSFVAPQTAHGLQAQLHMLSEQNELLGGKLIGLDIIGHTDAVGAVKYNYELGLKRAKAAYSFLQADLVGMAHNFQNGNWNQNHVEFMQAVLHIRKHPEMAMERIDTDIAQRAFSLGEAIDNPDIIFGFTNFDNTMTLEEHHAFLQQSSNTYQQFAHKKVNIPQSVYGNMPYFKKELTYVNGYGNTYIVALLGEYRKTIWSNNFNVDLDKVIHYKNGVISKGELEPLVNSHVPTRENRRVVLKGYINHGFSKLQPVTLNFGYFRMDVEGYASGYAGANLAVSGTANLTVNPQDLLVTGKIYEHKQEDKQKTVKEHKNTAAQNAGPDAAITTNAAKAEAKAEFFAGAKAEAGLKALLQWNKKEMSAKACKLLGSVGYAVNGSAGLGAQGELKIGFDSRSRRFIIKVSASATLGVGGGGKVEFTVGIGGLWDFVTFVFKQIHENDYALVDFFDVYDKDNSIDPYTMFVAWQATMLQQNINLAVSTYELAQNMGRKAQGILDLGGKIIDKWKVAYHEKKEAKALVQSIYHHKEMIKHAVPEVKGRALYLLGRHHTVNFLEDFREGDINYSSENAALILIEECLVSKRDWQETFEHMGKNATLKGDKAPPYLSSEKKGAESGADKHQENQRRMEENEQWLKTYLLNDAEDWDRVEKKKQQLWN